MGEMLDNPVGEAQARLSAPGAEANAATIDDLLAKYTLNEAVQLALRLLSAASFTELKAGLPDLEAKLGKVKDVNAIMMKVISMLDPDVERLVKALQALDGPAAEEK